MTNIRTLLRFFDAKKSRSRHRPLTVAQQFCLVIGLTCLLGFAVDFIVLSASSNLSSLEWRIGFCQQIADRGIILVVSIALLLYGIFDRSQLRRFLAILCMVIGVVCLMSSIVAINDSVTLRTQTLKAISTQQVQLQNRIDESQASGELPADITPQDVEETSRTLTNRAQVISQATGRDITRAGVARVGNLLAIGFGMVGLSRLGMRGGYISR